MRLYYPNEINAGWLKDLVESKVEEGKHIDFKHAIDVKDPQKKLAYATDLVSFANSSGGNIVYGVSEKNGSAQSLCGIQSKDVDGEKRKLIQIAENWVEPKIPGLHLVSLEVDEKKFLVLHVPESWNAPHMVCGNEQTLFKMRQGSQNTIMDIEQIRAAFLLGRDEISRFNELMSRRVQEVISFQGSEMLQSRGFVISHVVPISAIRSRTVLSSDDLEKSRGEFQSQPFHTGRARFNLEGYLQSRIEDQQEGYGWYIQVFRNGMLEFVDTQSLWYQLRDNNTSIDTLEIEALITKFAHRSMKYLNECQVPGPYYLFLTITDLSGCSIGEDERRLRSSASRTIRQNPLKLPEVSLIAGDLGQVSKNLRPLFDTLWQASGFRACSNYNSDTGIHSALRQDDLGE